MPNSPPQAKKFLGFFPVFLRFPIPVRLDVSKISRALDGDNKQKTNEKSAKYP